MTIDDTERTKSVQTDDDTQKPLWYRDDRDSLFSSCFLAAKDRLYGNQPGTTIRSMPTSTVRACSVAFSNVDDDSP